MSRRPFVLMVALLGATGGCERRDRPTPSPAAAAAAPAIAGAPAVPGAVVLIGAGDIASCYSRDDEATAALVDSVLAADASARIEDAVFTVGDNVYPAGSADDFARCFTPSWGDPAKRIMRRIHPAAGNHEYRTPEAAAYFRYFGSRAGNAGEGYYSFELGAWHVVVLNSELIVDRAFGADRRKAQDAWLARDLAGHPARCTVAYWHRPRFSSGVGGSDAKLDRVWRLLHENGVDLVLNGHDHDYERFLPQTPAGIVDSLTGITEMVVGTGGESLSPFRRRVKRNSVARLPGRPGALLLTLGADSWQSVFLEVGGRRWDAASGKCH